MNDGYPLQRMNKAMEEMLSGSGPLLERIREAGTHVAIAACDSDFNDPVLLERWKKLRDGMAEVGAKRATDKNIARAKALAGEVWSLTDAMTASWEKTRGY